MILKAHVPHECLGAGSAAPPEHHEIQSINHAPAQAIHTPLGINWQARLRRIRLCVQLVDRAFGLVLGSRQPS